MSVRCGCCRPSATHRATSRKRKDMSGHVGGSRCTYIMRCVADMQAACGQGQAARGTRRHTQRRKFGSALRSLKLDTAALVVAADTVALQLAVDVEVEVLLEDVLPESMVVSGGGGGGGREARGRAAAGATSVSAAMATDARLHSTGVG